MKKKKERKKERKNSQWQKFQSTSFFNDSDSDYRQWLHDIEGTLIYNTAVTKKIVPGRNEEQHKLRKQGRTS